jgi:ATP-binding cassette subfamily B (MDR/TAP) protein 1/ATP-binding cassette subfamily B (MDR/TAP) protein 4
MFFVLVIGFAVTIIGYLQVYCWKTSAINQCKAIRSAVYNNILRQHIGWFDLQECGELSTRLSE